MKNTQPHAIFAYVHHNRRVAAMVTLRSTTDFALRTDILQNLGNKLAMQAAATDSLQDTDPWMLDESKTVSSAIKEISDVLGETVTISQVQIQK